MTADHFADPEAFRNARLATIAMARGVLLGDALAVDSILDGDDLKSTAAALLDLTARLLMLFPHEQVLPVLDRLTSAALGPDGGRP